jgi:hypothetical protein
MILAGVAIVLLVGAVFFFAGQAESRKPEQITVSAPATNVGPQAETPAGTANAPTQ